MVQLFEKYRIVYPSRHQFLGDLFEQLLNKGFKQNEGQFFTPMPITRFIWDSLPIKRMIHSKNGTIYPKIIDYACGAGHFLTEAVEAINYFAGNAGNNEWVRDHIFGIEKDYRLARVAKISLFMNGAGEGNIIFGDGLDNAEDKQIKNGIFDILVANPPYSVKDFKQHLRLRQNKLELLDTISVNSKHIEVLFVERIAQLLKPKGIAAVILPNSILDNSDYTKAREHLLKNFYIRAIVSLGSKTFGATNETTVIMFLEKFNEPPKLMDMAKDSVDAIFSREELENWDDKEIFENYVNQVEVGNIQYEAFLKKELSIEELKTIEYFNVYVMSFENSVEGKKLTKTKEYQNLDKSSQDMRYRESLYEYINKQEREKIYYFSLIYDQRTVIIKSPKENTEQVEFLGYDWSNRKGFEGIQIITSGGKMYDDKNREAEGTLAHAIRLSFDDKIPNFSKENSIYGCVRDTKDMFAFSKLNFTKEIKLTVEKKFRFNCPIKKLSEMVDMRGGDLFPPRFQGEKDVSLIPFYKVGDMNSIGNEKYMNKSNNYVSENVLKEEIKAFIFQKDTIIFPKVGMAIYTNKKRILSMPSSIDNNIMGIWVKNSSELMPDFLYEYLCKNINLEDYANNANPPSISIDRLSEIKMPVPVLGTQQKIINECKVVNKELENARINIKNKRDEIEKLFDESNRIDQGVSLRLADLKKFKVSIGNRVLNRELVRDGEIPVYSANVLEPFGYINKLLITDFSRDSILWGIDGDWMVNFIPKNMKFYPTDHCGVIRVLDETLVNPKYLVYPFLKAGEAEGFSRASRASIERIMALTVRVPDIKIQNKVVKKLFKLEKQISELKSKMQDCLTKKQKILDNYLK